MQSLVKSFNRIVILSIESKVKNRIFFPIPILSLNKKTLEEIPASTEKSFNGRQKQTLAESPWTAQEVIFALSDQSPYIFRLIYVFIATVDNVSECLYAYWIFYGLHNKYFQHPKLRKIFRIRYKS